MATPYSQGLLIKQNLINLLTTQMVTGTLPTVACVGPVLYPELQIYPYVGVKLQRTPPEGWVGNHKINYIMQFAITASVLVKKPQKMRDAYAILEPIVDDGQGNGILPILRQQMYTQMYGLFWKSEIGEVIFTDNLAYQDQSALTEFYAEALIMWNVQQVISI